MLIGVVSVQNFRLGSQFQLSEEVFGDVSSSGY